MAPPSPDTLEVRIHESFDRISGRVSQNFTTYRKQFLIGLLAALILLLLLVGGLQWQKSRDEKAQLALYQLAELEKKILNPEATIPAGEKIVAASLPRLDPEKAKELEVAYRDAIAKYGKTRSGHLLHYQLANILAKSGRYEEARPEFETFYKNYSMASPYRGLGLTGAGFAALGAGENEAARTYLSEANSLEANPQKDFTLYLLGKAEEKLGEKLKAQTRYETLIHDFEQSPLANLARERLHQLKQSHPETAEKKENGSQVKSH